MQEAYDTWPGIVDSAVADLLTVRDRDPACSKYSQALLFFKGYQAIQCFRVQQWLWQRGREVQRMCGAMCGMKGLEDG